MEKLQKKIKKVLIVDVNILNLVAVMTKLHIEKTKKVQTVVHHVLQVNGDVVQITQLQNNLQMMIVMSENVKIQSLVVVQMELIPRNLKLINVVNFLYMDAVLMVSQ
jgi:conjugal transfer/entry exclusion protein